MVVSGATGQAIVSPTDVVKVRLQGDGRLILLGQQPRYSGVIDAFRKIGTKEGWRGYFKGVTTSVQRAAVINGTGIACYDHAKQKLLEHTPLGDDVPVHVLASGASGLMSTLVSNPFDCVKTRIMNQRPDSSGALMYRGPLDCLLKTVRAEGMLALYKGFVPTVSRLGPWQLSFFLVFEQVTKVVTGEHF